MKKLILGLLATLLMASGLVGLSGSAATAACPYSGCFNTQTTVGETNQVGQRVTINASVDALGTRRNPKGEFKFVITGLGKNEGFYQAGRELISNSRANFTTRPLAPGPYSVTVRYIKNTNSAFNKSISEETRFRVTR